MAGWPGAMAGRVVLAAWRIRQPTKILMVASYMTLAWLGIPALVVVRAGDRARSGHCDRRLDLPRGFPSGSRPNRRSCRGSTPFCQVFLMWFVLIRLAGFPLPPEAQIGLEWLVAFMAIVTLIQYVWLWSLRAVRISRRRRGQSESGVMNRQQILALKPPRRPGFANFVAVPTRPWSIPWHPGLEVRRLVLACRAIRQRAKSSAGGGFFPSASPGAGSQLYRPVSQG